MDDLLKKLFIYCAIWTVGANMTENGRKGVDSIVKEMDRSIPNRDTIYEYYVDFISITWKHWEDLVDEQKFVMHPGTPFYQLIVPTVDTTRTASILGSFMDLNRPILVIGHVGTGKSYICRNIINQRIKKLDATSMVIFLSAQTTAKYIQDSIESSMKKFGQGVLKPKDDKSMIVFLDDINMPQADIYGSQPPLELLRQAINEGCWYDRETRKLNELTNISFLAAMGVSANASEPRLIPNRLKSKMCTMVLNTPSDKELHRIYGALLGPQLKLAPDNIRKLFNKIIDATIDLFKKFTKTFLPVPAKLHYMSNLRDVGKVCEGLARFNTDIHTSEISCLKLWLFESYRSFFDRLISLDDQQSFFQLITDISSTHFEIPINQLCSEYKPSIFTDILNAKNIYELTDGNKENALKKRIANSLKEFNKTPGITELDVVLFEDAIDHVIRIVRVLQRPRGNLLLLGIGGSGRRSLAKLAAFICEYQTVQIQVSKHYGLSDFREDIKKMYKTTGLNNREVVFIFNDSQILQNEFLEDIGNILNGGIVPNIFSADDMEQIRNTLERVARRENISTTISSLVDLMLSRVRANLHIILCMNPMTEEFRNYVRLFPSLISCTTIDYFGPWPQEALVEVAIKQFELYDLYPHNDRLNVVTDAIAAIHIKADEFCNKMMNTINRVAYATPSIYLQFIKSIKLTLTKRREEAHQQINKLTKALKKVEETKRILTEASLNLDGKREIVASYQASCEEFLVELEEQRREAASRQKNVTSQSAKLQEEEVSCKEIASAAGVELNEAMPMLNAAIEALNALSSRDINEISSYSHPPKPVMEVMGAVMILKKKNPEWSEARRDLLDTNFIKSLINFDKDHIPENVLKRIAQIIKKPSFNPVDIGKTSTAAKSVCAWVIAIEAYARVFKVVRPKMVRYEKAMKMLEFKQGALATAISNLEQIQEQIKQLEIDYGQKLEEKNTLQKSAEETAMFLERASKMLEGTADKTVQWQEDLEV
ncbi:hypothetical protein ACOME3_002084 [Neoechinorhynchus agilis]